MKLKVIRHVLRLLAGRKVATDSDQHLQACMERGHDGDSDQHLQAGPDGLGIASRHMCDAANADRKRFDQTPRSEELGERARSGEAVIDPYSPVPEKSKFARRMEAAKNPRWRKHKLRGDPGPALVRPATHLEALLDDMRTDERVFGRDCTRQFFTRSYDITRPSGAEVIAKAGVAIVAAAAMDAGESIAHKLRAKREAAEREARLAVRRKYYGAEQAKRTAQNAAIRAAVPKPENRMPSAEELQDAYLRRHDSEEAKLRFGRLMIDLDEYVRCQVVRDGTRIVGTTGGVQEWLERNCPELAKHYHTCQRFKRKAQEDPAIFERRD